MLNLWIIDGFDEEKYVYKPDSYFRTEFKNDWLKNEMSRAIIRDIEKAEVISDRIINSPVFGDITPWELSSGTKLLLILLNDKNTEGYIQNLSMCGDNCAKWIQRISEKKDITARLGHIIDFTDEEYFDMLILNTNIHVYNRKQYVRAYTEAEYGRNTDY